MPKRNLPYSATLFEATNKKFEEIIFFVHFYEGSKALLKKHIEFVNDLGFDALAFNLIEFKNFITNPISRKKFLGIKHVYADQIESLLNSTSRKKIIFAFSNPCASAIEAMYYRNCTDIKGLICDSGPSDKLLSSFFRLFYKYKQNGIFTSISKTILCPLFWSQFLHNDINKHLNSFPPGFPILSIRGWKDELIPPDQIDQVFEGHPQLSWRKLSLPMAGHLNGLKDFTEPYTAGVEKFLKEIATPLT